MKGPKFDMSPSMENGILRFAFTTLIFLGSPSVDHLLATAERLLTVKKADYLLRTILSLNCALDICANLGKIEQIG